MHKIITSSFEIDLTPYDISFQEENSWFSETFFTKYSYPFDLIITPEINKSLGDVLSFDSKTALYYVNCQYVFYNKVENAVLFIERIVGEIASVSLKYGMDEFPNFDKNLNELDLESKLVDNIYLEAERTISKSYPIVNYNFPQVHTDKYDSDSNEYNDFRKIINNRIDGSFLRNTVEIENGNDIMYNRNIIQPMPYLMYVLRKGFELSGLELKGNIVEEALLNKILVYAEKEPVSKKDVDPISLSFYADELNDPNWTPTIHYQLQKSVVINVPGKYNIIGNFSVFSFSRAPALIVLKDDEVLYSKVFPPYFNKEVFIDFDFVLPYGSCEIKIRAHTSVVSESHTVFDFQILPVYFINAAGEKETNLLNENKVDLNKYVPNITFGNFVSKVLKMFNYDVDHFTENEIFINKISKSMRTNEIIDLSKYENINVERKPNADSSYVLKYQEEGGVDLGGFFIDKNETKYITKEFNKTVENSFDIDIFPLQNELIGTVFTAKSVQSSDDKLCFIIYDGLINDNNYSVEPVALSIPNLVEVYHYDWLYNCVHSIPYNISFVASVSDVINLSVKNRIFSYNNFHLIRNISKTQLKNELFEIELETITLLEK